MKLLPQVGEFADKVTEVVKVATEQVKKITLCANAIRGFFVAAASCGYALGTAYGFYESFLNDNFTEEFLEAAQAGL